jgi:hypothetical protein
MLSSTAACVHMFPVELQLDTSKTRVCCNPKTFTFDPPFLPWKNSITTLTKYH